MGTVSLSFNEEGNIYDVKKKVIIDPQVENEPIYDEKFRMWKVMLRKNPKQGYFVETLEIIKKDNKPRNREKDRGHFIADSFKSYLLTEREQDTYKDDIGNFFNKGNKKNISPQDPKANRNSKEHRGQLIYEQIIKDYFAKKEDIDAEVYYEIEEILENGNILGRRIFIHFSDKDDIHIFIPEER